MKAKLDWDAILDKERVVVWHVDENERRSCARISNPETWLGLGDLIPNLTLANDPYGSES